MSADGEPGLHPVPEVQVDQRLVDVVGSVDPTVFAGPTLAGDVSGGDVVEVEQLVGSGLLPPHGSAEVALVEQDGPDGSVRPATRVTVGIAPAVMGRR